MNMTVEQAEELIARERGYKIAPRRAQDFCKHEWTDLSRKDPAWRGGWKKVCKLCGKKAR